jgi:hypothetical protein
MGHGTSRAAATGDPAHAQLRKDTEKYGLHSTAVGPVAWAVLHCVAAQYPHDYHELQKTEQQRVRASYRGFLQRFAEVFPCAPCSRNWLPKTVDISDRHFESRTAFCRYVFDLHNQITEEVEARDPGGQRTRRPTFEQTLTLYESLRCLPPQLRKPGHRVHAVVRFQASRPRDSVQIDPSIALATPAAVQNHLLSGGWCPGVDGEPVVEK